VNVLFVLLPPGFDPEALWTKAPADLQAARATLQVRLYPPANDAQHLQSLVRSGRDHLATRWLRGMMKAIAAGAILGLLTNGVLSGYFHMFGGLLEIALPLGALVGAFLGAFTAAMTGTEVAREEVRALCRQVTPGSRLLQVATMDRGSLTRLADHCAALGLDSAFRQ
jgi:hypothetical protein